MGNAVRNLFGNSVDSMSHSEREVLYHGGDDGSSGGGMSDRLERRIERLEGDFSLTRNDLATLAERTANLSTKADVGEVKGELKADIADLKGELKSDIANLKGELKCDIANLKGEFKSDIANLKGEFKSDTANLKEQLKSDINSLKVEFIEAMDKRFDKLDEKARWKLSGVVIPVAVGILSALITFLVAQFSS